MTNKSMRQLLEAKYGKGCMFDRARIADKIEKMGGIKTYKSFKTSRRFTRRKLNILEKRITYHHLKHRSEGGYTNEENGANISELAHQYIHSLPRDQEEVINDMLREFKLNIATLNGNGSLSNANSLIIDYSYIDTPEEYITIQLEDNTPEQDEFIQKQKYQRAKEKQQLRRLLDRTYQEDLEIAKDAEDDLEL